MIIRNEIITEMVLMSGHITFFMESIRIVISVYIRYINLNQPVGNQFLDEILTPTAKLLP